MMPNAKQRQAPSAITRWTLVRQGSQLVPEPGVKSNGRPQQSTTGKRNVPCVFLVDGEIDCEVRVLTPSKTGNPNSIKG